MIFINAAPQPQANSLHSGFCKLGLYSLRFWVLMLFSAKSFIFFWYITNTYVCETNVKIWGYVTYNLPSLHDCKSNFFTSDLKADILNWLFILLHFDRTILQSTFLFSFQLSWLFSIFSRQILLRPNSILFNRKGACRIIL